VEKVYSEHFFPERSIHVQDCKVMFCMGKGQLTLGGVSHYLFNAIKIMKMIFLGFFGGFFDWDATLSELLLVTLSAPKASLL